MLPPSNRIATGGEATNETRAYGGVPARHIARRDVAGAGGHVAHAIHRVVAGIQPRWLVRYLTDGTLRVRDIARVSASLRSGIAKSDDG